MFYFSFEKNNLNYQSVLRLAYLNFVFIVSKIIFLSIVMLRVLVDNLRLADQIQIKKKFQTKNVIESLKIICTKQINFVVD